MPSRAASSGALAIIVLIGFVLVQPNVAANIQPVSGYRLAAGAISIIFLINLPLNLFVYSTLLAAMCRAWGRGIGRVPKDVMTFIGVILMLVFLITLFGAIIDVLLLYSPDTHEILNLGYVRWLSAAAAVALSVYVLSLLLLKMDLVLGAVPALAMMGLNLLGWWLTSELLEPDWVLCVIGPALAAAFLSVLPLEYLTRWHKKVFAHELADVA